MPNKPRKRQERRPRWARRILSLLLNGGLILLVVILVLALGGALARIFGLWGSEGEHESAHQYQDIATTSAPPPGEPGVTPTAAPPQRVGLVEVSPTEVNLGRVPLSRWVTPSFKVRNVSQAPLTMMLGNVETLEGC